jgi:methyltransferase (TIGR00027 family)
MAHGTTPVAKFADPTALTFLPDDVRARVERFRTGAEPATPRERIEKKFLRKRTSMMVARTVAIDDVVRADDAPQVVILGAGYDGRAWRMPELGGTVVFEVDHPDTQREKRARTAGLHLCAREVHFVPVDFSRDNLDDALAAAGHDAARPTTWIWEGVVMYLERADIDATLSIVARRSAAASRLTIAYISPALIRWIAGLAVRRLGEPFRSVFRQNEMQALLARHGFRVREDENISMIASRLSPALGRDARAMKHLRVVTAEKASA